MATSYKKMSIMPNLDGIDADPSDIGVHRIIVEAQDLNAGSPTLPINRKC
jgi:hypothetical protein